MTTKKKLWIFGAVVLVIALMLIIIGLPEKEQPEKEFPKPVIKVGYAFSGSPYDFVLFFVAQEKGFFDDYGLKVQLKEMAISLMTPALLTKEIDYLSAVTLPAKARLREAPVKIVAFLSNCSYALVSRPGLELNDLKTFEILKRFIPVHYVALKTIKEHNLSVEPVFGGGTLGEMTASLYKERVDALFLTPAFAIELKKEGYLILLEVDSTIPYTLSTHEDKIKNNPEEVEKMIKALQASAKFIQNNPQETQELLYSVFQLEKTEANQRVIEELYLSLKKRVAVRALTEEGMKMLIKLGKTGEFYTCEEVDRQTVTDEDINKVFDLRFVK